MRTSTAVTDVCNLAREENGPTKSSVLLVSGGSAMGRFDCVGVTAGAPEVCGARSPLDAGPSVGVSLDITPEPEG
jgi:hypothetical protein